MKKFTAFLFPLLLSTSAFAKITTYDWTGRITVPTEAVHDWSGQGGQPTWKLAIGDAIRGTFTLDDSAEREDLEGGSGVYQNAASLDLFAGGQHFTSSSHEWFVNSQFQGVGTHLMMSDQGNLAMNLDWVFPKRNPLDLTLAEATNIVNPNGSFFGIDAWEGPIETNANGVIDCIRKRLEVADAGDSAPTPEPSTFVLMGVALFAFGAYRFKRRARSAC